jgi:hypothetical protein
MTQPQARPEDRSRSGIDSLHEQPWADTHPGCFRSEGFAEDLPDAALQPTASRSRRTAPGLRRQGVALPLLGVAVAGVLSAFGR